MENDVSDNQKEKYLERVKAGGGNREEKGTKFQEEEKKETFFSPDKDISYMYEKQKDLNITKLATIQGYRIIKSQSPYILN